MVYQNLESHKEKRTLILLDKTSNTEFFTEHILSSLKGYSIPKTAILRQDKRKCLVLLHLPENEESCLARN